jgi:hypothetical protein
MIVLVNTLEKEFRSVSALQSQVFSELSPPFKGNLFHHRLTLDSICQ